MTIIYRSIFVISLLAHLPFLLVLSGQMYNIIKSTTSYYVYKRISCYFDCIHMREWTGSNRKCMTFMRGRCRWLFFMQTCDNIANTELSIARLREAIRNKEDPIKVAQTRLYTRESRPNVDLCRDPVHYQ